MRISVLTGAAFSLMVLAGCARSIRGVANGDPDRGAAAISRYGCGTCHSISGLPNAHGMVGPPLTGIRDRIYVAGMLQNTPDNVVHWIRSPKSVNERTAMPDLGVTLRDATDITAYLYAQ